MDFRSGLSADEMWFKKGRWDGDQMALATFGVGSAGQILCSELMANFARVVYAWCHCV